MTSVVPESDHRPREIILIAQGTQARRTKHEISTVDCWLDSKPPGRQYPNEMPARKNQHITHNCPDPANDSIRPGTDLLWRLPSRATVPK